MNINTNTIEYYRQVREAIVKYLEEKDDMRFTEVIDEFKSTYSGEKPLVLILENGDTVTLDKHTPAESYEIARLDDPIQFAYFKLTENDDFIIYDEGYYDSWSGGEWEGNVRVGQLKQHTIDYPVELD